MLEYLKERILPRLTATKSPQRSAAADDLTHIEQVIRETQDDLKEAREAIEHFREQLAACDARVLLDEPDTGDELDADDYRQQLLEAQEDVARLSATLPRLEAQRNEAQHRLQQQKLATCLETIDQHKRHYSDLSSVLTSQLGCAADTAAEMAALTEAIEVGRTQATALQVEMGRPPSGISFTAVDVRVLWQQSLSKARRPAVTTSPLPAIVDPPEAVATMVTGVITTAARTWFEDRGHRWELSALPTPSACRYPVGNKSSGAGCGEPATRLARYILPTGELREWPFCESHTSQYAAAHHLTTEGS